MGNQHPCILLLHSLPQPMTFLQAAKEQEKKTLDIKKLFDDYQKEIDEQMELLESLIKSS